MELSHRVGISAGQSLEVHSEEVRLSHLLYDHGGFQQWTSGVVRPVSLVLAYCELLTKALVRATRKTAVYEY
jgi:hypothetical protein